MEIKRIAIVMFGMLRSFEHTAPFFKRHIEESKEIKRKFPNCEFDYFFFGYPNKAGIEHCERRLKELYNPKSYSIIEWSDSVIQQISQDANDLEALCKRQAGVTSPINCLSGHRCRKLSNNLRVKWAQDNHVNHDIVICARIDTFFFRDINEEDILLCQDENSVVIPDDWDFKCVHQDAVSDTFAIGNESSMNLFFQSYENFPRLVLEKGYHFHPETLLGAHMKDIGLNRKTCKRHIAFEYPFSESDIFLLWKKDWNKEEVEKILGIDVSNLGPRHRGNL